MNKLTESKLLLGAGMAAGIGIYGLVEQLGAHKVEPSPQECIELQKETGAWWHEHSKDSRNSIREICDTIISEDHK